MNLRPPGYEPGELPDCSTPRRGADCSTLVTVVPMWDWAIWAVSIGAVLAGVAALVLLVLRSRDAWRELDGTRRRVIDGLDEFASKAEATADRVEATADGTAELQESLERLRVSLARLAVLRAAIDEADDTFGGLTAYVPRK